MSEVGERTVQVLREFHDALQGIDKPGFCRCEICGRERVQTWRVSSILAIDENTYTRRQVELCGPCLADDQKRDVCR